VALRREAGSGPKESRGVVIAVYAAEGERDESIEYHFWEAMTCLVREKRLRKRLGRGGSFSRGMHCNED